MHVFTGLVKLIILSFLIGMVLLYIGCEKEASQECQIYTNMALRNIIVLLRLQ